MTPIELHLSAVLRIRDPGLGAFLTPGSRIRDGRKSASGSGMNGKETIRIRDGKKSDPESGINIPDPPHCLSDFNF
jgi:hypothetical protein